MSKKYDYSHWGWDLVGCICVIYLFICIYRDLSTSNTIDYGSTLSDILIILHKYFGEKIVYLLFLILFLYFF